MILRQFNVLGQMRWDAPFFRLMESSVAGDFDVLSGKVMAGNYALIVTGFQTISNNAIGAPATSLQVIVANSILQNIHAAESGSLYAVPSTRPIETLSTTNSRIIGSFTSNATNYIGVDLRRTADPSTSDLVQFISANTDQEIPEVVPLGRTLDYVIVISTQDFSATPTLAPVVKVVTDVNNAVVSLTDARNLFFRLGSGGSVPDANYAYPWPGGRVEVGNNSDFNVGDKAILSLKDWCNAVMTRLWEVGGGEHWYSETADRNVKFTKSGTPFLSSGDYFEWDGFNLHWKGLKFVFDNSTGFFNDIQDQTTSLLGLTNLADGDCLYVDLDRSQNRTGATALVATKVPMVLLGNPITPYQSRFIFAWRSGANVFTRDQGFPVNQSFSVATTVALGAVRLSVPAGNPASPVVINADSNGRVTNAATSGNSYGFQGTGFGTGSGIIGIGGSGGGFGGEFTGGGTNTGSAIVSHGVLNSQAPQEKFEDSAGNIRDLIDHNGYLMGRNTILYQPWFFYLPAFLTAVQEPLTADTTWSFNKNNSGGLGIQIDAGVPGTFITLTNDFVAGSETDLYTTQKVLNTAMTYGCSVVEFELNLTQLSDFTAWGFNSNKNITSAAGDGIFFQQNPGSANIRAFTVLAGTSTIVDTGVAASTLLTVGITNRFRIEWYGSTTPEGVRAKFYINEVLVANTTTNIPGINMYLGFTVRRAGGGPASNTNMNIGPVRLVFNRFASGANL